MWLGSWRRLREHWPNAYEVSAWHGDELIGIVLLFRRTVKHIKLIPVDTLFINESGDPRFDMTVECNGFLVDSRYSQAATKSLCEYIDSHWQLIDEVFISGINNNNIY